jgi:cytoskeletal protein CcmA (bactofilin family)
MFGSDKSTSQSQGKRGVTTKDPGVTILTSGCHFTGKLYCRGATRIGGTIEGQVIAEGLLVVENDAVVTGDVDAEDIVIHGRVEGKLEGRNRVEMCATADVAADISTPSLVVHDGAMFNGKTSMKRKQSAASFDTSSKSGGNAGLRVNVGNTSGAKGPSPLDESKVAPLPDVRAARTSDVEVFSMNLDPEPAL